ncbi:phage tail protein [Pseudophaeobacter sp.]|uniref:phage tail protein n=1 Tax=Pseudophaeobacter sp. TaxID=1971739 RepID=UPI003A971A41
MAGLQEQNTWENEVYQIEETDPVHAGPPDLDAGKGHTNVPHAQLANRTLWLKGQVTSLVNALGQKLDITAFTAAAILQKLADQKIGTEEAHIEAGKIIWGSGVNRITSNDGGGNVQIRFGHRQGPGEVLTHDGTAFYIGGDLDGANGKLTLKVAKNGGAGTDETVIWGDELTIAKGDILFGGVSLRTHCGMLSPFDLTEPPSGWLECNGAAISRTSYSNLFDAIGTRHGNGDGATTFNLPDYRGEFIRGWDHGRGVDAGRALGSAQGDMLEAHQHAQTGAFGSGGNLANYTTNSSEGSTVTALNNETGSTGGTETRPRNLAAMICIKY